MRADHDHRNAVAPHDLFQHVQTAHARHFEVEGNNLRLEFLDLLQPEISIHGGADHLDGVVGSQNLRDELAHQRGIIYHEHSYRGCAHNCTSAKGVASVRAIRSASSTNTLESLASLVRLNRLTT